MYWEETKSQDTYQVPDDIVDLVFDISCRTLPVDHHHALSVAIASALPWFRGEELAGMHPVHVAESGNGWMRPENPADLLHLSRRTKLVLRVPGHRVDAARALSGRTLDVGGFELGVGDATPRMLSEITTLFSRYVVANPDHDETEFLDDVVRQLAELDIRPRKMLPGRIKHIRTPEQQLTTRSLMVADLEREEAVRLQRRGLGPHRHLGCGIFIPHKDINEVRDERH
ncbi:MAG: type I-MYXAN CRISPR-associated protein Cas6/Cmx6 [Gammaproteobacteria bacterium]|nr:MAG: type I-MYXAN CRISPR-associated protein Cas6/Cmx6 [Gammaproteobacteria bacterium]